jgi:hypothetical protein
LIKFTHRGNFDRTERFLKRAKDNDYISILTKYALQGLHALINSTPKDSGLTSDSWSYDIEIRKSGFSIYWKNKNLVNGIPVVILLQYGHGTRSGSFVEGRDFINPAMRPIFDSLSENLWKEVTSL